MRAASVESCEQRLDKTELITFGDEPILCVTMKTNVIMVLVETNEAPRVPHVDRQLGRLLRARSNARSRGSDSSTRKPRG
jgi:hypothetical protein